MVCGSLTPVFGQSPMNRWSGHRQPAVACDKSATNLGQSWMIPGLILAQSGTSRELIGGNLRQPQAAWDKS